MTRRGFAVAPTEIEQQGSEQEGITVPDFHLPTINVGAGSNTNEKLSGEANPDNPPINIWPLKYTIVFRTRRAGPSPFESLFEGKRDS